MGVSGSPRYLVGKEGWFFHRSADDALAQARGVSLFTPLELERWIGWMEARQSWLAERGIEFLVVIAPGKQSIYPEFLPDWANQVGPTRYDQIVARLRRGSSFELLDLHGPLLRAKASERLYFRSDGHWNDLGAFVAYRAIAEWIAARHPDVRVLSRDYNGHAAGVRGQTTVGPRRWPATCAARRYDPRCCHEAGGGCRRHPWQ